jgi:hypothetical protein
MWFKFGLGVQSLPGMAAAGIAMVALFGITGMLFVYRGDPYVDFTPRRLRVWSRA